MNFFFIKKDYNSVKTRTDARYNCLKFVAVFLILGLLIPLISVRGEESVPEQGIKNVLFIILDALRADHLGIYGYSRNTSPHIDEIARRGVVFDRAIVQSGWTKSSIPSYFTSTYPSVHGVVERDDVFPPNLTTMAEIFRYNGYFTIGLVDNVHIRSRFNYNRGFDIYKSMGDDEILEILVSLTTGEYPCGLQNLSNLNREETALVIESIRAAEKCNLVRNPGFEAGNDEWNCDQDWITSREAHSGTASVHIDKREFPSDNFWHLNQSLKLKHGFNYLVGAFVKTRGLKEEVVFGLKEENKEGYPFSRVGSLSDDNDWTLTAGIYTPSVCDENYESEITIRPGRVTEFLEGDLWVDDVFIIPLAELSRPILPSPTKVFYYVHFLDPHAPYTPPDCYLNIFKRRCVVDNLDRYDGEIRSMDEQLGLLFEAMESAGVLDETLIIITSDHGEGFGEHGFQFHHANFLYDETVRVPMIIFNPTLIPSPKRIKKTVQAAVGLLPSLIDILGLKVPPGTTFQGSSFFQSNPGESAPAFFYQGRYLKMITNEQWKYISGEYSGVSGDTEVRGEGSFDEGVKLTMISPVGSISKYFFSEDDLRASNFFQKYSPGTKAEILRIYNSADRNQENFGDKKESLLFNLVDDPGETIDVAGKYPEKVEEFKQLIYKQRAADRAFKSRIGVKSGGKAEITNRMKQELRTLGYCN